ncbi:radical SAM protein [Candidatus Palauibacter sp.]|uniref:radical SAM protein n=1 Tax=Candidatus Palauibacter sp. TaxID=3101350 RepID=UPI003B59D6CC
MTKQNILLVEPGYRNKYPPLGLMKIAAYHGSRGRGDNVLFVKGHEPEVLGQVWDRVYVTTLFSFEWKRTSAAIDFALRAARGQAERVFVGGIAASLMFEEFLQEPRWAGVRFITGLLDGPPAVSLQLSTEDGDFGADDLGGTPIEEMVPDYSILEHIQYTYPVRDAYFGYASRGCIRKCSFCGVPKLEGAQREMPPLAGLVDGVGKQFGPKKDLILMDNNVVASARYTDVIAEIRDLGFQRGALFARTGAPSVKRRVDFNQGVDARILAKTPMYLREMSTICIDPLRIAFDHVGMRRVYERSVEMAADYGLKSLSNYMLYNFMDTPSDLYERMNINIALNQRLGVQIWSFPMRYLPVTMKDRSHVGKNWNRYYLRSFQIMLQATHGVVSGSNEFFHRAFGSSYEEFEKLLALPHAFIFHRDYYENGGGRPVLDEYNALLRRLSSAQRNELTELLSGVLQMRPRRDAFLKLASDKSVCHLIRQLVPFHAIDTKAPKVTNVAQAFPELAPDQVLPEPEALVEDAGLYEPIDEPLVRDRIPLQPVGPDGA